MASDKFSPQFVMLVVLDGWGIAAPADGNAIEQASTVNFNKFKASYPHTQLSASGEAVGLPRGEDGNTETGHLNLGSGRIVYQDLERINMAVAEGNFFENETLLSAVKHAKENNSDLHYMGLVGAGGVHSSAEHLYALIHLAKIHEVKNLYIHVFTDGRDSPPTAAKTYIDNLQRVIKNEKVGKIATIMGRYWAMDRDQRWDRTKKAYFALTKGEGLKVKTPEEAIEQSYSKGETDEFIEPSVIVDDDGKPISLINDGDACVFFNFRIDRPRQLTKAFVYDDFSQANIEHAFDPYLEKYEKTHIKKEKPKKKTEPFKRGEKLKDLRFVTMTEYGKPITKEGATPAFPPDMVKMPLGQIISSNGLKQLRITESEKERFVTFYFNGLRNKPFPLEKRMIHDSPEVSTYDQAPDMSADKITESVTKVVKNKSYKFILVNYPNADMVGHTGNIGPTVKAVEKIDECLGKLANLVITYDGILLITADHGNAEEMINASTGEIDTEHSTNPVPFIAVAKPYLGKSQVLKTGILADVAPTVLNLLELPVPQNMTGKNLLKELEEY